MSLGHNLVEIWGMVMIMLMGVGAGDFVATSCNRTSALHHCHDDVIKSKQQVVIDQGTVVTVQGASIDEVEFIVESGAELVVRNCSIGNGVTVFVLGHGKLELAGTEELVVFQNDAAMVVVDRELIGGGGRGLSGSETESHTSCFIPGFGSQIASKCQIPFLYKNADGSRVTFKQPPSISEAPPYFMDDTSTVAKDSTETWCPSLGTLEYDPTDKAIRNRWGVAECDYHCKIRSHGVGWMNQNVTTVDGYPCELPFRYREKKGWKTFDYPPTILEAKPFGLALLLSSGEDKDNYPTLRWCPPLGTDSYSTSDSAVRTLWGSVECAGGCKIKKDGKGLLKEQDSCQIPFEYLHLNGTWERFDAPPTIASAKPYGLFLLGLDRNDDRTRWCPPLGVYRYQFKQKMDWGEASCGDESDDNYDDDIETTTPTPLPTTSILTSSPTMLVDLENADVLCSIGDESGGWIEARTPCQIPFRYKKGDGTLQLFDYPPTFLEAKPFGLPLLDLNSKDDRSRWCPRLGRELYDRTDETINQDWGIVETPCQSRCHVPAGGGGWIKDFSECQFPFRYKESDGSWTTYNYPPTFNQAKPYALHLLGLTRDDNITRWCPAAGVTEYDFKQKRVQKDWGIVSCENGPTLPPIATLAPTGVGEESTCTTDGGYAAYDMPCHFPFRYNGETYHECVTFDEASPYLGKNNPPKSPVHPFHIPVQYARWCALDVDYNDALPNSRKRWGYCNPRTCNICTTKVGIPCRKRQDTGEHCFLHNDVHVCEVDSANGTITYEECDMPSCNLSPTSFPTIAPTLKPSSIPSKIPTGVPSRQPIPATKPPVTPQPTHESCQTDGGYVRKGSKCRFPFRFGGKWYNRCMDIARLSPYMGTNNPPDLPSHFQEGDEEPTHWCPTVAKYDVNDSKSRKKWGYCKFSCNGVSPETEVPTGTPTDEPTKAPTPRPAPRAISATYVLQGYYVQVVLDHPVRASVVRPMDWFDCAAILELSKGDSFSCRWLSDGSGFMIRPQYEAVRVVTIQPGALEPNQSARHSISVGKPLEDFVTPVLSAPSFVSACDDMTQVILDASKTPNHRLLLEIHFLVQKQGADSPVVLSHCSSYTNTGFPVRALQCNFNLQSFLNGQEMGDFVHVAVQVRTIFQETLTSDWRKISVDRRKTLPQVIVDGPSILVVPVGGEADLPVRVRNNCALANYTVSWVVDGANKDVLVIRSLDGQRASVQPWRDPDAGSIFTVSLLVNGQTRFVWYVHGVHSELVSQIHGGNRSIEIGEVFVLDGSTSYDPNLGFADDERLPFVYEWQCSPRSACENLSIFFKGKMGNSVVERPGSWTDKSINSLLDTTSNLYAASNLPMLSVRTDHMNHTTNNLQLKFHLMVKSHQSNRYSISKWPIVVGLLPPEGTSGGPCLVYWSNAITPGQLAQFIGECKDKSVQPRWSVVNSDGKSMVVEHSDQRVKMSKWNVSMLEVDASVLVSQNDIVDRFTFQLHCGETFSAVVLPVNPAPREGMVEVHPAQGFAGETKFEVFSWNWIDVNGDLPLRFHVEYRYDDALVLATGIVQTARSEFVFPDHLDWGVSAKPISITVVVYDTMGAMTEINATNVIWLRPRAIPNPPVEARDRVSAWLAQDRSYDTTETIVDIVSDIRAASYGLHALRADVGPICALQVAYLDRLVGFLKGNDFVSTSMDAPVVVMELFSPILVILQTSSPDEILCEDTKSLLLTVLRELGRIWVTAIPRDSYLTGSPVWPERLKSNVANGMIELLGRVLRFESRAVVNCEERDLQDEWAGAIFEMYCKTGSEWLVKNWRNEIVNLKEVVTSVSKANLEGKFFQDRPGLHFNTSFSNDWEEASISCTSYRVPTPVWQSDRDLNSFIKVVRAPIGSILEQESSNMVSIVDVQMCKVSYANGDEWFKGGTSLVSGYLAVLDVTATPFSLDQDANAENRTTLRRSLENDSSVENGNVGESGSTSTSTPVLSAESLMKYSFDLQRPIGLSRTKPSSLGSIEGVQYFEMLEMERTQNNIDSNGNANISFSHQLRCGIWQPNIDPDRLLLKECLIGLISLQKFECLCNIHSGYVGVWGVPIYPDRETDEWHLSSVGVLWLMLVVLFLMFIGLLAFDLHMDQMDALYRGRGLYTFALRQALGTQRKLREAWKSLTRLSEKQVRLRRCVVSRDRTRRVILSFSPPQDKREGSTTGSSMEDNRSSPLRIRNRRCQLNSDHDRPIPFPNARDLEDNTSSVLSTLGSNSDSNRSLEDTNNNNNNDNPLQVSSAGVEGGGREDTPGSVRYGSNGLATPSSSISASKESNNNILEPGKVSMTINGRGGICEMYKNHLLLSQFTWYDCVHTRTIRWCLLVGAVHLNLLFCFLFVSKTDGVLVWILVPSICVLPVLMMSEWFVRRYCPPIEDYYLVRNNIYVRRKRAKAAKKDHNILKRKREALEESSIARHSHRENTTTSLQQFSLPPIDETVIVDFNSNDSQSGGQESGEGSGSEGSRIRNSSSNSNNNAVCGTTVVIPDLNEDLEQDETAINLEGQYHLNLSNFLETQKAVHKRNKVRAQVMILNRLYHSQQYIHLENGQLVNRKTQETVEPRAFVKSILTPHSSDKDPSAKDLLVGLAKTPRTWVYLLLVVSVVLIWAFIYDQIIRQGPDGDSTAVALLELFALSFLVDMVIVQSIYACFLASFKKTSCSRHNKNVVISEEAKPSKNRSTRNAENKTTELRLIPDFREAKDFLPGATDPLETNAFTGFQEEIDEEGDEDGLQQSIKSDTFSQFPEDEAQSCGGESTTSSYAQVPRHLLEEESESFRRALTHLTNHDLDLTAVSDNLATPPVSDNHLHPAQEEPKPPLSLSRVNTPPTTGQVCNLEPGVHAVSLQDLELESDF